MWHQAGVRRADCAVKCWCCWPRFHVPPTARGKLRLTCYDGHAGTHADHHPHPDLDAVGAGAGRRAGARHAGLARRGRAGHRAGTGAGWCVEALRHSGVGAQRAGCEFDHAPSSAFRLQGHCKLGLLPVQQLLLAGESKLLTVSAARTTVFAGMPAARTVRCRLSLVATWGTLAAL